MTSLFEISLCGSGEDENVCKYISATGDSRWLELRSLEVLDLSKENCGPVFLLYKTKQIYSPSLEPLDLSKFFNGPLNFERVACI